MVTKTVTKPKLYQYEVCPFCWKAKAALAYKGVDFDKIEVHPLNKKELDFSTEYRKVPIYIDSHNEQVNDSNPILFHIDKEYPEKSYVPVEPELKERDVKYLEWCEVYVKALSPLIYKDIPSAIKAFDYITKEGKFSWTQRKIIKYSGALVMNMVAKKKAKEYNITDPENYFRLLLDEWVKALDGKDFIGGDNVITADIAVFGVTMCLKNLPAYSILSENKKFYEWMTKMSIQTGISLT